MYVISKIRFNGIASHIPFVPPVSLKALIDLTVPKTSVASMLPIFPVSLSSLRSSIRFPPLTTQISCALVPLKLPTTASVMLEGGRRVKL